MDTKEIAVPKVKSPRVDIFINIFAMITIFIRSVFGAGLPLTSDSLWQIRDGRDQLLYGKITTTDTWSWVSYNTEWTPNSWLWNLLLGKMHTLENSTLIFVGVAFLLNVIFFLLVWGVLYYARIGGWARLITLIAIQLGTISWLSLRPQIVDYIFCLLFLLLVLVLTQSTTWNYKRILAVLLPAGLLLLLLWQNLHLTALLGIAFFITCLMVFVTARFRIKLMASGVLLIGGIVLLFLTPYGFKGISNMGAVGGQSLGFITEWSNLFYQKNLLNVWLVIGVVACLIIVGILAIQQKWIGAAIMFMGALVPMIYAVRFIPYVLITGLIVLVASNLFEKEPEYSLNAKRWSLAGLSLLIAISIPISLLSASGAIKKIQNDEIMEYGVSELAIIPSGQRIFADLPASGVIIYSRPDLKVIVDGRVEVWGSEYMSGIQEFLMGIRGGSKFFKCINQEKINVVVLSHDTVSILPYYLASWIKKETDRYTIYMRPEFLTVPSPTPTGIGKLLCDTQK